MPQRSDRVAHWAQIIHEYRQSRLTQPEFCRQRGIALGALKNWLYKAPYRQAVEQRLPQPTAPLAVPKPRRRTARFVPVALAADSIPVSPVSRETPPATARALEVRLGSGRAIAVAPGFDPDTLRRLIALLEDRA
jgi:transposase